MCHKVYAYLQVCTVQLFICIIHSLLIGDNNINFQGGNGTSALLHVSFYNVGFISHRGRSLAHTL